MGRNARVALAVVGGAVLASAAGALAMAAWGMALQTDSPPSFPLWLGVNFALTLPIAATAGLAWHALASARGWCSLWAYMLPGAAFGALVSLGVAAAGQALRLAAVASIFAAILILYGALLGAFCGCFFWLIRRPDRHAHIPGRAAGEVRGP